MIQTTLTLHLPTTLYQLEEATQAEAAANNLNGVVGCWKTSGLSNWLERGFSVADVLVLVVLPVGLPDTIEMPDDEVED